MITSTDYHLMRERAERAEAALVEKDRQIAALVEALKEAGVRVERYRDHSCVYCGADEFGGWDKHCKGCSWFRVANVLSDLSSAAAAHDARVRAEAIEECALKVTNWARVHGDEPGSGMVVRFVADAAIARIRALKEQP